MSRCQCPPGRTASGERCACRLKMKRILRVDLVDRGASVDRDDPEPGDGSRILIAKRDGGDAMTITSVTADTFGQRFIGKSAPRPSAGDAREAESLVLKLAEELVDRSRTDITVEAAVAKVLSSTTGGLLYAISCAGRGA
jgi:hypothetical protein